MPDCLAVRSEDELGTAHADAPIAGDFDGDLGHVDDTIWCAPGPAADYLWDSAVSASRRCRRRYRYLKARRGQ